VKDPTNAKTLRTATFTAKMAKQCIYPKLFIVYNLTANSFIVYIRLVIEFVLLFLLWVNIMVILSNPAVIIVLAQQIVDLNNQISLAQPRVKRRNNGLKEMEFLTLCHLRNKDLMNVGDIQKLLGVLPAQMSRIIRSLENRDIALIACSINPLDKRKIDVALTEAGNRAFETHQTTRVSFVKELLIKLNSEEIEDLKRLVDRLSDLVVENTKVLADYSEV